VLSLNPSNLFLTNLYLYLVPPEVLLSGFDFREGVAWLVVFCFGADELLFGFAVGLAVEGFDAGLLTAGLTTCFVASLVVCFTFCFVLTGRVDGVAAPGLVDGLFTSGRVAGLLVDGLPVGLLTLFPVPGLVDGRAVVPAPGLAVGRVTLLFVAGFEVGRVSFVFVPGLAEGLFTLFPVVGLAEGLYPSGYRFLKSAEPWLRVSGCEYVLR
jgi:hypothetical protein